MEPLANEKKITIALEGKPEGTTFGEATERDIRVRHLIDDNARGLAQCGPSSQGGYTSLTLFANLTFHDGERLDAEAAKQSLKLQLRDEEELVEAIRADGLTLKFREDTYERLSLASLISPRALVERPSDVGSGAGFAGPWKLSAANPPNGIGLEPHHTHPHKPKHLQKADLLFVPDGTDAVKRLKDGDIDFLPTVTDPDSIADLKKDPCIHWKSFDPPVNLPNVGYLGFCLKKTDSLVVKPMIRQALVLAINVNSLASIGQGQATPAQGPIPPGMNGYPTEEVQAGFNDEQARALLKQAGYNQERITLLSFNLSTYAARLARGIEVNLKAVGLKLEVITYTDWNRFLSDVRGPRGDMFLYFWNMRQPRPAEDPYRILRQLFHSDPKKGIGNLTGYRNSQVDSWIDTNSNLNSILSAIFNDPPMVFVSHWSRFAAWRKRLQNFSVGPGALISDRLEWVDVQAGCS